MEFFVGRMNAIVGKGKAHQYGWHIESLLEGAQDRNGAPGAQEDGCHAKAFAVGERRRPDGWMPRIDYNRVRAGQRFDGRAHRRGRDPCDVVPEKPLDFPCILIGDETKAELCRSAGGDDALTSWTLITARD